MCWKHNGPDSPGHNGFRCGGWLGFRRGSTWGGDSQPGSPCICVCGSLPLVGVPRIKMGVTITVLSSGV